MKKFFKKTTTKKNAPSHFPSIYRFFTDHFSAFWNAVRQARRKKTLSILKLSIFTFTCIILLLGIAVIGLSLKQNIEQEQKVSKQREEINLKIAAWENIVATHKGYRDGYFQLAVLEYQLGDNVKSRKHNRKALALDPNFSEGRRLEEILDKPE